MATTPTDDALANSDRTVGVHAKLDQDTLSSLKRVALLFDQIGFGDFLPDRNTISSFAELGWLRDIGIVWVLPPVRYLDPTFAGRYRDAMVAAETGKPPEPIDAKVTYERGITKIVVEKPIQVQATDLDVRVRDAIMSRFHSINLRFDGINAFPILNMRRQIGNVFPSAIAPDTTPVLEVILKSMPIPDDQTPWEDIIEFRNDPESMKRLRRLRVWTRKFAKATTATSLAEMKEEIEVLLDEYEEHMKLHRMKVNKGATETLLTVAGKVAEDFPFRIKWSELAKLPFIPRERKISLLKAEQEAPNRELAFISMAKERFST